MEKILYMGLLLTLNLSKQKCFVVHLMYSKCIWWYSVDLLKEAETIVPYNDGPEYVR